MSMLVGPSILSVVVVDCSSVRTWVRGSSAPGTFSRGHPHLLGALDRVTWATTYRPSAVIYYHNLEPVIHPEDNSNRRDSGATCRLVCVLFGSPVLWFVCSDPDCNGDERNLTDMKDQRTTEVFWFDPIAGAGESLPPQELSLGPTDALDGGGVSAIVGDSIPFFGA